MRRRCGSRLAALRRACSIGCLLPLLGGCGDAASPADGGTGDSTTSTSTTSTTSVDPTSDPDSASIGTLTAASTETGTPVDTSSSDAGTTGDPIGPDCTSGEPIDAAPETWTWIPFPDTHCALDGNAGIAINPAARGNKLLIALEGGGACFTESDCQSSRLNGIDDAAVLGMLAAPGPFDRSLASNPFAEYSYVFVPYCTGDFHSGDNVTDWGAQHVGYANMGAFLERVVPTFCDTEQVVLTGFSAGGFGASFNYTRVHEAFGSVAVDLIDDSGPYMTPAWMPSDVQALFDASWGFRANMPADCDGCATGWDALYTYAATRWPEDRISIISSRYDPSIQDRFSPYTPLATLDDFAVAIDALADEVFVPLPNAHVFLIDIPGHVWLPSGPLDGLVVSGVSLEQFVRAQIEDDPAWADVRP